MAKLQLEKLVTDINGKPLELPNEDGVKSTLSLKETLQRAILNAEMDKKDGKAKFEAYQLAMKLNTADPDLTVDELKSLKDAVGKIYGAVFVGFVYNEIEAAKS
jgi:hypothetical protein